MEIIEEAFLILFVIDGSVPYPTDFDPRAMDKIKGKDILILENKSDLPKVVSQEQYPESIKCIEICAHQKKDTEKITSLIEEHLSQMFSRDPSEEVMINARHQKLLINSLSHLKLARDKIDANESEEFVLQELSTCRNFIDEIIGVKSNEDILDKLFNEFCIGK